ncbi:hypothetical protein Aduo_019263 [Ancylostoma duodenale]
MAADNRHSRDARHFPFQDAHERHQGQMYQCDICQMQFSQKANMHRHRMRHSGVKPYECRYCKKRFFRKDQVRAEKR